MAQVDPLTLAMLSRPYVDPPLQLSDYQSLPHLRSPVPISSTKYTPAAFVPFLEATKTYKARVNDHTVNGDSVMRGQACTFGNENAPVERIERKGIKGFIAGILVKRKEREESAVRHSPKIVDGVPFVDLAALEALEREEVLEDLMVAMHSEDTTRAVSPEEREERTSPARDRVVVRGLNMEDGTMVGQIPVSPVELDNRLKKEKAASPKLCFNFATFTKKIQKKNKSPQPDYRNQMVGLVYQPYPSPNFYGQMPETRVGDISHWVSKLVAHELEDERQDDVLALTTAELLAINGANIDRVQLVKRYQTPRSSRLPAAFKSKKPKDIGLEEIPEEFKGTPQHKDLINYIGVPNTPSLSSGSSGSSVSVSQCSLDLSDYYNIPLIEPAKSIQTTSTSPFATTTYPSSQFIPSASTSRLSPVASLILYLHAKGLPPARLLHILGELSPVFLYSTDNRWLGTFRIPELTEFTDEAVRKIREMCKREHEHWEYNAARDEKGAIIPLAWKVVKREQRRTCIKNLVVDTLQDFLGERCEGVWVDVGWEEEDEVPFFVSECQGAVLWGSEWGHANDALLKLGI